MVVTNNLEIIISLVDHLFEVLGDPHIVAPVEILFFPGHLFRNCFGFIKVNIGILVVLQSESDSGVGKDHTIHPGLFLKTNIHPAASPLLGGPIE